jgi:FKBP-type peptidyl-prolyl cis-trans isomerase FkpA
MKIRPGVCVLLLAAIACAACASDQPAPSAENDLEFHRPPANEFEAAFAKQPGVQPVRWGGWMKTEVEGSGAMPTPDSVVKVNYRGTLTDGTEFDDSSKHGGPATFSLRGVVPCWTNGVPMMKVGGKAEFVCPAVSAYGDAGSPPRVPGGATLVFEIELLDIVK